MGGGGGGGEGVIATVLVVIVVGQVVIVENPAAITLVLGDSTITGIVASAPGVGVASMLEAVLVRLRAKCVVTVVKPTTSRWYAAQLKV